jgi:hypothetical protein
MSLIPTLAEILAERLGRTPNEMQLLLREALAESERRRWQSLTAEERESLNEELERARDADEPPFPPEVITRIPLSMLPFFVRRVRDDLATVRKAWYETFANFNELSRSLTLWYHEHEKLQITAAEKKASVDGRVQDASRKSRALKDKVDALEHAESNLLQELEVRLVLVRSGVLPDPEAVRPLG